MLPLFAIRYSPTSTAPIAVLPAARQPHRGQNQAGHGVGLRKISPQGAGLRIDIFRQQPEPVAMLQGIKKKVIRVLAPSERPPGVDEPEPADQKSRHRQSE